jgi:hypothetical protein
MLARRSTVADSSQVQRFNARQFIRQRLRELLDGEIADNPRLNADHLAMGLSLDDCVALFYSLVRQSPECEFISPSLSVVVSGTRVSGPPANEEEFWVPLDDPPLVGRIDQIRNFVLIDFKTGEPSDEHAEQLRFYAVLWWGRYDVAPQGLEIHYKDLKEPVAVPGLPELATLLSQLKQETTTANLELQTPPPTARPGVSTCQFCPVRQLCDAYWTEASTLTLRLPEATADPSTIAVFRDVRVTVLPKDWRPGISLNGQATAAELGAVELSIPQGKCPQPIDPMPTGARILNAKLIREDDFWVIKATATTEVFWEIESSI